MSFHYKKPTSSQAGFSLVEMIVVIAVFGIMTAIVLANLPEFRDRTNLELLAQQIAINIRSAQVYGVGTRVVIDPNNPSKTSFDTWYGIHYSPAESTKLVLFADANRDGFYDEATEYLYDIKFPTPAKYQIYQACSTSSGVEDCDEPGSNSLNDPINIIYRRPSTDARFCFQGSDDNPCADSGADIAWANGVSNIVVEISAIYEAKIAKGVTVWSNGQINVVPGFKELNI